VQKARRCGLTTMTILTDWQTGQRDMTAPFRGDRLIPSGPEAVTTGRFILGDNSAVVSAGLVGDQASGSDSASDHLKDRSTARRQPR
jgi:hypothetical protein